MSFGYYKFFPFLKWRDRVTSDSLKADLMAGLTGMVLVLPQAVAYAFIAGLPPEYGLYTAMVSAVIASLFGSSWHLISGPTAALSIVVLSVISGLGEFSTEQYIGLVISLTLLTGLIQLALGLFRMGSLVNFISHTVVIGFTAGAAILIAVSQLKHLLGIDVPSGLSMMSTVEHLMQGADGLNQVALQAGLVTLGVAVLVRKLNRKWPHLLIGMAAGSLACYFLDPAGETVAYVGSLPGQLPQPVLPEFSFATLQALAPGALAVALLGLIEAVSIARAIAVRSNQQIDGNQEFLGQGLSNVVGSFFACYASTGSFTRSGANYDAGARTPLAAVFAALLLAIVVLVAPQLTARLPLAVMAGSILLIAWNLIDFSGIRHILSNSRSEAAILVVTLFSTLLVELEFAIYIGVMLSLALYLRRTSQPRVTQVAPLQKSERRHIRNIERYDLEECPQLKIIRVDGSLFFGAVDHVQQEIRRLTMPGSGVRHILLVGKGINFIDVAGVEMLHQEINRLHMMSGDILFSSLKGTVMDELERTGALKLLGEQRFHDTPRSAIATLIPQLDQDRCATCTKRIFGDCPPLREE
ncbi:SulP family inorganic anion transporter [Marinobacterium sediminicola]|uniref:Sulfate permease, SulP family n=1 Tax=Marinobacterium sediminicola TaxID=518898 RepID=A0ABY1S4T6_9GAMM|nr:SulP family inorganic anion transporter [Marinobacterium sediminicola]ULG68443.1 SulP family inorganic anion transporter [Marinobacterium sediminicola]SMR78477.1 sulfate permease, SulP family [Marinobacterium sediminicola]